MSSERNDEILMWNWTPRMAERRPA